MTSPAAGTHHAATPATSVFAGADVARAAGFALAGGARGPVFGDDVWDFADVAGLPAQLSRAARRWDFTTITDPGFRLVAKELLFALLAPRHQAVAALPRAYRAPLAIATCRERLASVAGWLNWLTGQGITSLAEVTQQHCDAWLEHRRHARDERGRPMRERGPASRRETVAAVLDLYSYAELFTVGGYQPGLRPWNGKPATTIAGVVRRDQNATPPVADRVLQPMLAAALHVTEVIGPFVADLAQQVRAAAVPPPPAAAGRRRGRADPVVLITGVLAEHAAAGSPLPLLAGQRVRGRLNAGWDPGDPLLAVSLGQIATRAGLSGFDRAWMPALRPALEGTLARVGTAAWWGRDAARIPVGGASDLVPWTLPLHAFEVVHLTEVARTACLLVIAAVTGMRAGELMELTTAAPLPPRETAPGLARYKLAGRVIKDQPHGGTPDEWVVIAEVHRAARLAASLLAGSTDDAPGQGSETGPLLFGRFSFDSRYRAFRDWVSSPAGQRLGLTPIPGPPPTLRALRRTLAIELAYRPGGLLAAKLHMKHISVATTEGYAARPGGAQARLLAEVSEHEQQRNLELTLQAFRDYQQGIHPSGPGARELLDFFASVDDRLTGPGSGSPAIMSSDREVLNLLSKRARTLHLAAANYCWFAEPAKALCLRLAGTPDADKPLAGLCDSARCPQATHHSCHRGVWAGHAASTTAFLGTLGPARRAEKTRLQQEHARSLRVLQQIDSASATKD
jgi:hypothetical protein